MTANNHSSEMAIYYLVSINRECNKCCIKFFHFRYFCVSALIALHNFFKLKRLNVDATCDHQSGKIIERRIRSTQQKWSRVFFNRAKEVIDENLRFKILNWISAPYVWITNFKLTETRFRHSAQLLKVMLCVGEQEETDIIFLWSREITGN